MIDMSLILLKMIEHLIDDTKVVCKILMLSDRVKNYVHNNSVLGGLAKQMFHGVKCSD